MINQAGDQKTKKILSPTYRNPIHGLLEEMKGKILVEIDYLQIIGGGQMFAHWTYNGIIGMEIHGKFFKTNYHVR